MRANNPTMTDSDRIINDLPTAGDSGAALFFGGSFDPPHAGHTTLPLAVSRSLEPSIPHGTTIYVPAARSPHKEEAPTPAAHRIAMLRLAISENCAAWIWTGELDRARHNPESPSYWADTWAAVRRARPDTHDRFLIGADQALSMHRWHRYQSFWRDAIVVLRDDHDESESLITALRKLGVWSDADTEHWRTRIAHLPLVDASSTQIRESLADPKRRENPIAGLDDRVHDYILKHGLYRAY
jgi:nicotinate-nucleotide adenylyltransferase